jgi:hypothetical protein
MNTESKSPSIEQEEVPAQRIILVELERGSISVSLDGLTFTISGQNVKLERQNPLSLTLDSGDVQYDDNEISIRAEGEAIKLRLD